jgi:hypothetical protein
VSANECGLAHRHRDKHHGPGETARIGGYWRKVRSVLLRHLSYGSNASIVLRRGLEPASNDLHVDTPIRLQTGDQFWSSLLTRALIGLGHWI